MKRTIFQRVLSALICVAMLAAYLPGGLLGARAADGAITTVADPETLTRPGLIYGDTTLNAGKITVGKSVSNGAITVNGQTIAPNGANNFLVTISQSAQVMGLASQSSLPVDVVFVLDTSGSMGSNDRAGKLVTAANSAISSLLAANDQNRVAVVAFSSSGEYGGGTSDGAAANVLSSLAHYDGDGETNHLRWVNEEGTLSSNGGYIAGRDSLTVTTTEWQRVNGRWQQVEVTKTTPAYRNGKNGGTNIQAGIALGASLLTAVTDTTWTDPQTQQTVTRIPFLIVISDGQPTFISSDEDWYAPEGSGQMGPGNGAYEGNGFMAAMTAAYFKGKITEHYYGQRAGANEHCYVYTMGVELGKLSGDDQALAQITLDPSTYATGDYAAEKAVSYYRYGNSWDGNNPSTTNSFMTYWSNFEKGEAFKVRVDSDATFTFTAESIAAAQKYVNGIGYNGGLLYNDAYYAADNVSQMNSVFTSMVAEIQKKALSVPTKITTGDHNFDGYVHFYDPIGEYMEVKDMKGVLAGGFFFQGLSFAQKMAAYGTAQADAEFDDLLRTVLKSRMGLSSADDRFASEAELDAFVDSLLKAARDSDNQANYTDADHYDNSFVWWGNAYDSGEEDEHVQLIGFADNDTIDYITDENTEIPAGADYVCRSYFFYGEAGGSNPNPDHEYLYFVVRVQRELVAPYRQTVVISAPASLLSVEKVMITESVDENGNTVFSASVEHQEPARVVYEVGLWDTITPENVSLIVSGDYAGEQVNGLGSVNYDPTTGIYNFFTNDWNRGESLDSHHRGMAKATFDAAADNSFYTYQTDTLIVDKDGNPVTADPAGTKAYYVREYYVWSDNGADGTYTATKTTALISVDIPADAALIQRYGGWYIPKGTYTGATLVANGDDTLKDDPATEAAGDGNKTGTSSIVAHPHRTGDVTNSHYTVLLGNNGMLSMVADPYAPEKSVAVTGSDGVTVIDGNGKPVQVGDVLTYTIKVKNVLTEAADIVVTDYVPNGTAFVAGSAAVDGVADETIAPDSNRMLAWKLQAVPAGESREVTFKVTVEPGALSAHVVAGAIANTAMVTIGNTPAISSNPVYNPPYGKTVTDENGVNVDGKNGGKVGDILTYSIRVTNTAMDDDGNFVAADVTVTDIIPAGTVYVEGSADNGGVYANGVLTWKFENMAPGAAKVVSFKVLITADADTGDGTQPEDGQIALENAAYIQVENAPVITTNVTVRYVEVGDMVLSKTVAAGGDTDKVFTIHLHETTGALNGTYVLYRGTQAETVTFTGGKASVTIRHGEKLTIKGLPVGAIITVEEDTSNLPGWTPAYNTRSVTIVDGAATTVSSVSVTNTYTLQPLTLTLKGVKTMTGAALTEPVTFGFVAVPDSANPEVGDPLSGEVTVSGNGSFTFTMSAKTFTKPGVYKYTITEINGGIPGVNYDGTAHVLQINVMDNGDGTMKAEASLNGNAFDMAAGAVAFSNSYVPEDCTLVFGADKALTGRELVAGEFSFLLSDGTNTYRGINDAEGNILFEAIRFTKVGTYTYTLSEVIPTPAAAGMTYDTATYTVTVTVTDEGGKLVPAVSINGRSLTAEGGIVDTGVLFTNKFVPADAPLQITAKKTLLVYDAVSGDHVATKPEAGAFRFRITDAEGNTMATGINDANGNVVFETFYLSADLLAGVTPDAAGNRSKILTFTIAEIVPELTKDPNMKYDTAGREISVLMTHTAEGKLIVSVNGDSDGVVDLTEAANFINYGNPGSVSVTPVGYKTTVGENLPAGLSFSFAVIPVGGTEDASIGTSDATAGGTDRETDHITFGTMTFSRELLSGKNSASFEYWIVESNAGAGNNGVTYDTTRYLYRVTVSVEEETGLLVAKEEYFALKAGGNAENAADYTVAIDGAQVSFTNTYAAKAHINLTADKHFSGRPEGLKAGEFDFLLQRLDATGKIVPGSHITGTNDASGVIHFATLNYSNEMLSDAYRHDDGAFYFSYLMTEIKPADLALPGVTYDESRYVVTIKVTQGDDGMTATLAGVSKAVVNGDSYAPGAAVSGFTAGGDTNVTFTNVYQAVEGDVVRYKIRKVLEGRQIRAGEFEFGLYFNGQLEDVATNDANGIITFSRSIPATAAAHAGIYKMTIKELTGSLTGVTYSSQEFTVYVKVEDNGSGKIVATVHLTEDGPALEEDADGTVDLTEHFVFTNTYEAHDTTYTPVAGKALTGRDQIAGEFSFEAQLIHDGAPVANGAVYRGINDADGKVLFQTITFTDEGTYIYKIREIKGAVSGMRYDNSVYYLKVVVTDDGNGHLKASAGYFSDEACTKAISRVTFTNAHIPASVPVTLVGNKTLAGRPMADQEFSFLVYKQGDMTTPVASGNNDANGNIRFSTFNITAEDMMDDNGDFVAERTFTYIIKESDNHHPGVTYAAPVTVTVTVTNNNGVFTAKVNYPEGDKAHFHNVYDPGSVSVPLEAYKTLQGKNMQAFEFELKAPDGTVVTLTNDAFGVIHFEALRFTAADLVDANGNKVMEKTFVYTLTEKGGEMSGMHYDRTVYTITVTVTDDGKGTLTADVAYAKDGKPAEILQFVNTYTPAALTLELEGMKTIVDSEGNAMIGENFPLSGFEFMVFDAEGHLICQTRSDDSGKIRLTGFTFTAAGEYRFTVVEKITAKPGYSTDPAVWCVHITIGYDADQGLLFKSGEYIHIGPENHDGIQPHDQAQINFANVYDPADVSLIIKGMKDLEGRDLREHEFTFYMVDDATGLRAAESRNHGNGEIHFSLHYDKAGTYTYTVYEEIPQDPAERFGVTYTTKTHTITVEVTDDGTGALKARVDDITVLGNGDVDLTDSLIFTNIYSPESAGATVEALKYLEGKELLAGKYTFELVNADNAEEVYTATNLADGRITFAALQFSAEDLLDENGRKVMEKVFTYHLSEIKGEEPGVTYDERFYVVRITVTDDAYGQLHTTVTYADSEGNEVQAPTFINKYEAAPVTYTPVVSKVFEGADMRGFTFVLTGEGFMTQTKSNDGEGTVRFDELTFDKAGTYIFTVTEQVDETQQDVLWDTNIYTLTIQVADPGDGQLDIADIAITSDNGRTDLVFHNVHEDLITKKDVFLVGEEQISIDGRDVRRGDVLLYTIRYKNYTGKAVDVTITDAIPAHTAYVEGSADNGGTLTDGILTWTLTNIAPGAEVTVSFRVEVIGANETITNTAVVQEGMNTYTTNTVSSSVPEDEVVKDVTLVKNPDISIDKMTVEVGDVLVYTITYRNSYEAAADVTIIDTIPQHTAYVEGSADNGGIFENGLLTWQFHLEAGESVSVSFRVKVTGNGAIIVNQATAMEGENSYATNAVTVTTPTGNPKTGDAMQLTSMLVVMGICALGMVVMLAVIPMSRKKAEK